MPQPDKKQKRRSSSMLAAAFHSRAAHATRVDQN
jgi:hypothetical protein